ncbi:MAG TPA: ChbG/HpnK family deacetylase [Gammaproteobacteria bacterium]
MKTVTLCADDYALDAAVSRGILTLAERGRLSAVSCMSASHHWREHAAWLAPLRDRIDIGLHLTLTGLPPLGPMPHLAPQGTLPTLGRILVAGVTHRLPREEVAAELQRQLQAFITHFGRAPDFIDGHQHVHLLPHVRETVFELWESHLKPHDGYLRSCHEPLGAIVRRGIEPTKALIIAQLSAVFTRRAREQGILINDSFRGVHDFSGNAAPHQLFSHFFQGEASRPLVMCHPGYRGTEEDELRDWRPREFDYFSSDQFAADLAAAGLKLGRLTRQPSDA